MGWALVFSGQGHQHPQMLAWLQRDDGIAALEARLGADWRNGLATPEAAAHNRRAQILLTATACTAWAQLQARVPPPALIAGYSVGELPAFAAAGVFDAGTAIDLAGQRADCMDQAAAVSVATGLLGISGAPRQGIEALCDRLDLDVAIRIDPGSAVVGGPLPALDQAAAEASAQGWRCTPLNVRLASHTRWMHAAVAPWARALDAVNLRAPALPLFSNALGQVRDAPAARTALVRQVAQTVAWDACMAAIAERRVQAVLEIGPGAALARLWQDRHVDVPARSVDEFRSAPAIAAWLLRHLGPR